VVLDDSASEVRGEVFAMPNSDTLAQMDAYEGFYPGDAPASLFLRVKTVVALENAPSEVCWVYVYNGPLPGR
jgi:gamma-glutamylcyclotransferase (GGCT)/AIG2-like uncharacterized protein YtfP